MLAPLTLDIGPSEVALGARFCATARERDRGRVERALDQTWGKECQGADGVDAICALSVRTGLDAFLATVRLPVGSAVLMSAITIPDMVKIVQGHGLTPIVVDVDAGPQGTFSPRLESMQQAYDLFSQSNDGKHVRAVVISHIFGSIVDNMDAIIEWSQGKGLLVIEDCAEAFQGLDVYRGHDSSDVSLFSFGTIKTATALGGAMLRVRDEGIRSRMKTRMSHYATQSLRVFASRISKVGLFSGVLNRPTLYGAFVRGVTTLNFNHTDVLLANSRGFAGQELFSAIRQRPPVAMLQLLLHRLETYDQSIVEKRAQRCKRTVERIESLDIGKDKLWIPGCNAKMHSYWLFPVVVERPEHVAQQMLARGFDATVGTTNLACIDSYILDRHPVSQAVFDSTRKHGPCELMRNVLYLPMSNKFDDSSIDRMVDCLGAIIQNQSKL